jgi:hypothetical protein
MRIIATILMCLFSAHATPRSAREYYNEIYAAGGLDRFADGEVCFDEDVTKENFVCPLILQQHSVASRFPRAPLYPSMPYQ